MKKLLSVGVIAAIAANSAFAFNIKNIKKSRVFNQVKIVKNKIKKQTVRKKTTSKQALLRALARKKQELNRVNRNIRTLSTKIRSVKRGYSYYNYKLNRLIRSKKIYANLLKKERNPRVVAKIKYRLKLIDRIYRYYKNRADYQRRIYNIYTKQLRTLENRKKRILSEIRSIEKILGTRTRTAVKRTSNQKIDLRRFMPPRFFTIKRKSVKRPNVQVRNTGSATTAYIF